MARQAARSERDITPSALPEGFKLAPKAGLLKRIKTELAQAVARLDDLVKELALQAMAHAKAHGDVTIMDALIAELPRGYLNTGFRQWMTQNSPIRIDPKDGKLRQMKPGEPGYRPYNLEAAAEAPMVKRETNANAGERLFGLDDAIKLVSSLRTRVESAEKRGALVKSDKGKILQLHSVVVQAIDKANLGPPTKVISVKDEAEESNRKQARGRGQRLIAKNRKPRSSRRPVVTDTPANTVAA